MRAQIQLSAASLKRPYCPVTDVVVAASGPHCSVRCASVTGRGYGSPSLPPCKLCRSCFFLLPLFVHNRPSLPPSSSSLPSSHAEPWWTQALRDIFAGTLGGIAGKVLESPFDTIKTRIQGGVSGLGPKYKGSWDCVRRTVADEGVRGLFKGMAAPLAGTVLETSLLFLTNGALKRQLMAAGDLPPGADLPMQYVLLAGAGTGFVVSFVLTPTELIKCRLQVPAGVVYSGPMDVLRRALAEEGVRVLYRGHVGTMLREVPGTACWFGAYEAIVRRMTPPGKTREDLSPLTIIAAGALGGCAYWTCMFPADGVKSAMQIMRDPNAGSGNSSSGGGAKAGVASTQPFNPSFTGTFLHLYRTTGIRGLYAGLLPTMLRAAPSNAAIFWVYELAARAMKDLTDPDESDPGMGQAEA